MQVARNANIWPVVSHQELSQLSPRIQVDMMNMGAQIFSGTTEPETAAMLARRFYEYRPRWVRKQEPIWMGDRGSAYIVDWRDVEYTIEEQRELHAQKFLHARPYHFFVASTSGEGLSSGHLRSVDTSGFDRGQFVDEERVARARVRLMKWRGEPIAGLLDEINRRRLPAPPPSRVSPPPATAQEKGMPPSPRRAPPSPPRASDENTPRPPQRFGRVGRSDTP